jgi:hypothetical protein
MNCTIIQFTNQSVGHNTNIRGFGTSRATFFRQKHKKKKTLEAASCTRSIDSFFKTLDYGTDDEPETPLCDPCNVDAVPAFATYAEAIAELGKLQLFSRDARIDSRRTGMTWETIRELAVTRYFTLLRDGGHSKRSASHLVAQIVYGKSSPRSYKSRQIRHWADQYLRTGLFPKYKQGNFQL